MKSFLTIIFIPLICNCNGAPLEDTTVTMTGDSVLLGPPGGTSLDHAEELIVTGDGIPAAASVVSVGHDVLYQGGQQIQLSDVEPGDAYALNAVNTFQAAIVAGGLLTAASGDDITQTQTIDASVFGSGTNTGNAATSITINS